jgi:hypothetical protein
MYHVSLPNVHVIEYLRYTKMVFTFMDTQELWQDNTLQ